MEKKKVKAYTKTELAIMYSPDLKIDSAIRRLRNWINHNKPLCRDLDALCYNKRAQIFTPAQVELIFHYLGEP